VRGKTVAGVTHVKRLHQRIARDLRDYGGRGDTGGFRVALDNRLLRDRDLCQAFCVDQKMCGVTPSLSTARRIARMPAQ
jgi:hypothetical protein